MIRFTLLSTMLLALGCQTETAPHEQAHAEHITPLVEMTQNPGAGEISLSSAIRTHARWMHKDTQAIGVMDLSKTMKAWSDFALISTDAKSQRRLDAHHNTYQRKLKALSSSRFGVDITKAQTAVYGLRPKGSTLIVLGIAAQGKPHYTIAGFEVYKLYPRHAADTSKDTAKDTAKDAAKQTPAWGVKVPGGLALFESRELLEELAHRDTMSLAKQPARMKAFEALVGSTNSRSALAALMTDKVARANFASNFMLPSPEAMLFTSDKDLRLLIKGPKSTLDKIHMSAMAKAADWRSSLLSIKPKNTEKLQAGDAMLRLTYEYLANAMRDGLTVERSSRSLSYAFPLRTRGWDLSWLSPVASGFMFSYLEHAIRNPKSTDASTRSGSRRGRNGSGGFGFGK